MNELNIRKILFFLDRVGIKRAIEDRQKYFMPEENWINYVSRKELILLEDAAADLKFEQYELVNNMRRHSPS